MNPIRILAVDDDLDFRYLLTHAAGTARSGTCCGVCHRAGGLRCGCPACSPILS